MSLQHWGSAYMHQMRYDFGGTNVMASASQKGKGMGRALEGHKWTSLSPSLTQLPDHDGLLLLPHLRRFHR